MSATTRTEHDLLGDKEIPSDAYYGVQTARALENFHISGVQLRLYPNVIKAFAMVKMAAARANFDCGQFSREILTGIEGACQELIDGKLHDEFRLDVFQGGAGTSTNMNANEVIANRALELMGHKKGEYKYCDPHDHVNGSQSTNDAYPSSLHVGMALGNAQLVGAMNELIAAFRKKGAEFSSILKMGRTQLQDAVPMTLGQEFEAFAATLGGEVHALERIQRVICEVNMGATAIGTGLNAPAGYAEACTKHLATITGLPIYLAENLIEATQDTQAFVLYSSCMKSLAIKLSKVCNDLRLLSSGPRCGLREINLPAEAAGLVDHAGQGEPGDSRSRQHGLLPRHRQRPDRDDGGRRRPAAVERLRAGDCRVHLRGPDHVHQRGADAAGALRRGHHGQRRRLPALRRVQHRHRDGAQPGDRLRALDRARGRGDEDRPRHHGAGSREEHPDRRADRGGARSGRDDGAGLAEMTTGRRTLVAQATTAVLVAAIWWTTPPEGLTLQAWRLFALFAGAIFSVVVGALPILTASVLAAAWRC